MNTEFPTYRIGDQQRDTLRKLQALAADCAEGELGDLIDAAIGADLPAQAVADVVGTSYSSLASWLKDGELTTSRKELLPRISLVGQAIGLGVATGLLPTTGDKVGPALAVLVRLFEMRAERDQARQAIAVHRSIKAPEKKSPASDETLDSYAHED